LENRYIQGVRKFDPELARIEARGDYGDSVGDKWMGTDGPAADCQIIKREGLFGTGEG
jgi:hypothetical protein